MSASAPPLDPDERDRLAGEYVLGTLDAAEQRAVEAALADDVLLCAAVAAWQDRLLGLTRHAPPAEPSPALWGRIARDVGVQAQARMAQPKDRPAVTPAQVRAQAPGPAPTAPSPDAPGPARAPAAALPWWRRLVVWQGASAVALALALVLAVLLWRGPAEAPRYLAVLQNPAGTATGWVVEASAGGRVRLVPVRDDGAVPAGKSLQFWTKAEGAAGPTSLGLVRTGQTLTVPAAAMPTIGERQLFEVTLEPEGGSTIGRPTGPVLYIGRSMLL